MYIIIMCHSNKLGEQNTKLRIARPTYILHASNILSHFIPCLHYLAVEMKATCVFEHVLKILLSVSEWSTRVIGGKLLPSFILPGEISSAGASQLYLLLSVQSSALFLLPAYHSPPLLLTSFSTFSNGVQLSVWQTK